MICVGHARDLVDRLDRQAEFVVAQPEHQELQLLGPLRCLLRTVGVCELADSRSGAA